ncbi:MAG: hypothetical protein HY695_32290, partial [Deltaproteobacteria bacterium]|nr:hypothetical protein [Deltaproteobacteria bacterium]
MKVIRPLLSMLLLAGTLGWIATPVSAQEGVLFKVQMPGTNYCHMKFPAIRPETLSWDRPVLKDASTGDLIDFYGSCNHDPLGKEEIIAQQVQRGRQQWG